MTYFSAQDAGAPHVSHLPSGGVQPVGCSELGVDAIVKISTVRTVNTDLDDLG